MEVGTKRKCKDVGRGGAKLDGAGVRARSGLVPVGLLSIRGELVASVQGSRSARQQGGSLSRLDDTLVVRVHDMLCRDDTRECSRLCLI